MGGGSSTKIYEEWDSTRQRPYKHIYIKSRKKYRLEDTLYTKGLLEKRIPIQWKNANMVINFINGEKSGAKNHI